MKEVELWYDFHANAREYYATLEDWKSVRIIKLLGETATMQKPRLKGIERIKSQKEKYFLPERSTVKL